MTGYGNILWRSSMLSIFRRTIHDHDHIGRKTTGHRPSKFTKETSPAPSACIAFPWLQPGRRYREVFSPSATSTARNVPPRPTPIKFESSDSSNYVGDVSTGADLIIFDMTPQRNSKHSPFHRPLSELELPHKPNPTRLGTVREAPRYLAGWGKWWKLCFFFSQDRARRRLGKKRWFPNVISTHAFFRARNESA